jgi:hypothetical protein
MRPKTAKRQGKKKGSGHVEDVVEVAASRPAL